MHNFVLVLETTLRLARTQRLSLTVEIIGARAGATHFRHFEE